MKLLNWWHKTFEGQEWRCYRNPTFTPYLGKAEPDEKIEIVEGEI